jgi:hypothetical protein
VGKRRLFDVFSLRLSRLKFKHPSHGKLDELAGLCHVCALPADVNYQTKSDDEVPEVPLLQS